MKVKMVLVGIVVGAFLGVAVVFVLMGGAGTVAADCPGPAGEPCGNGDCNGDGQLNIADAMHLLTYLFLEGPRPAAVPCPPSSLPATGQTTCYLGVDPWEEVDCGSGDFPGQDGFYQAGCPMEGRFVDNGDGTVTDTCTGLMWQQETADTDDNGVIDEADDVVWGEALRYCDALILCEDGTWTTDPAEAESHGGVKYDDWRLPNVRELQSIVDYGRWDPAIDAVFSAESSGYWSSSSGIPNPVYAWFVSFYEGIVYGDSKNLLSANVRTVRGGL